MTIRRKIASVVGAMLLALSVSACALTAGDTADTEAPTTAPTAPVETTQAPPPSPPEEATPAPSPEPTAEPTADPGGEVNLDDPSTWTITAEAIGPFTIGSSFDEISAVMQEHGWTQGCGEDTSQKVLSAPDGGPNITVSAAYDEATGDRASGVGTISLLGDAAMLPTTEDGLGVGSAVSDFAAAFPTAEETEFGHGYTGYVVRDDTASLYFGAQSGDLVTNIVLTAQTLVPMGTCD